MKSDSKTVRWHQRLDEFKRALALFKATDAERRERALSKAEQAGLVQFFELTVELGWKTMGGVLEASLVDVRMTPIDVIRAAVAADIIDDGDSWAEAIKDRNRMAHVYDVRAFDELVAVAGDNYTRAFDALVATLEGLG